MLFTDTQPLTEDSGAEPTGRGEADLYECQIEVKGGKLACALTDLTPKHGEEPAEAQGQVLGASEDGSYLYLVARGVLSEAQNARKESAIPGKPNLYLIHDGATSFIATLGEGDNHDWGEEAGGLAAQPTRVSNNGQFLELMSEARLTGYDNRDTATDKPAAEVFIFDASTSTLSCASCDPTGARPEGVEYHKLEPGSGGLVGGPGGIWGSTALVAANVPGTTAIASAPVRFRYQPRYLSNSGRLFFNTADPLVSQDSNNTQDVYEYEPLHVGDCEQASPTFSSRAGGCISLISSGGSARESAFMDASESGDDVFFLTAAKLSKLDTDAALDIYDAHVCTGAEPCITSASAEAPPCSNESSCKASPTPQPSIFGAPASATFSGPGNPTPPPPTPPKARNQGAEARQGAEGLPREEEQAQAPGLRKDRTQEVRRQAGEAARQGQGQAQGQAQMSELLPRRPRHPLLAFCLALGAIAAVILAPSAPIAFALSPWWHLTSGARPAYLHLGAGQPEVPGEPGKAGANEVVELTLTPEELFSFLVSPNLTQEQIENEEFTEPGQSAEVTPGESAGEVQAALEAVEGYGPGNVQVEAIGGESYKITFTGSLAEEPVSVRLGYPGGRGVLTELTPGKAPTPPTPPTPATDGELYLSAENVGDANVEGSKAAVKLKDLLPAGLEAAGVAGTKPFKEGDFQSREPLPCSLEGPPGAQSATCTLKEGLAPYDQIEMRIAVRIRAGAHSGEQNRLSVLGGGAPPSSISSPITISSEPVPFGVESYEMALEEEGGATVAQAGAHPFQLSTTIALNQLRDINPLEQPPHFKPGKSTCRRWPRTSASSSRRA